MNRVVVIPLDEVARPRMTGMDNGQPGTIRVLHRVNYVGQRVDPQHFQLESVDPFHQRQIDALEMLLQRCLTHVLRDGWPTVRKPSGPNESNQFLTPRGGFFRTNETDLTLRIVVGRQFRQGGRVAFEHRQN
jgi:hypothetical protein